MTILLGITILTSLMCARDGHIYYVSLLFLEIQDVQNYLYAAVSMATELSGTFLVIYFFVPVIYLFVSVNYFFVLLMFHSKGPA